MKIGLLVLAGIQFSLGRTGYARGDLGIQRRCGRLIEPIQPGQLGSTLGQTTISDLARAAGMSEQDLLAGLAQALPGVIDKLTPRGRLPTADELSAR